MAMGALAVVMAFTWAACDSGDDGGEPKTAAGDDVAQTVTAAEGGTVASPSGDASLAIPAGALPADTEITIEGLDATGLPTPKDLGSAAYEFGPDGLQFAVPVTLSLNLSGKVPSEKKAVLAVLDGDKWVEVAGSSERDGVVSGPVTHFSTYVILFVGDKAIVTTLECQGYVFEACGGDPTGNWTIKDLCLEMEIGENPFAERPECADQLYQISMDFEGYIHLNADKTYEVLMTPVASMLVELDDECLDSISQGQMAPADMCVELGKNMPNCAYAGGKCSCSGPVDTGDDDEEPEVETGTWSTEGTNLFVSEDGETDAPKPVPFCVKGNTVALEVTNEDEEDPAKLQKWTLILEK
jgi:hypothetical protein